MHTGNKGKGRPKGSLNKKNEFSLQAALTKAGVNPAEELIQMLPLMPVIEKIKTLRWMHEFIEPKATVPLPPLEENTDLSKVPSATLFSIINANPDNTRSSTE